MPAQSILVQQEPSRHTAAKAGNSALDFMEILFVGEAWLNSIGKVITNSMHMVRLLCIGLIFGTFVTNQLSMRILPLVAIVLLMNSCGGSANTAPAEKNTAEVPAPKAEPGSNLDQAGTARLTALLAQYYTLKDALVASDPAVAAKAAASVVIAADSLKSGAGSAELDSVSLYAGKIQDDKAMDIEQQRAAFEHVSDNLFALLKNNGLKNAGVYRQFCPMAFNDKGASWLSNTDEIRNPYFGKKMLECGEVTDSLK